jgi:hypothetical protein
MKTRHGIGILIIGIFAESCSRPAYSNLVLQLDWP